MARKFILQSKKTGLYASGQCSYTPRVENAMVFDEEDVATKDKFFLVFTQIENGNFNIFFEEDYHG